MAVDGVVYLLCFDRPLGHARHYTGWTSNLEARLSAHAAGRGARLLAVVRAAGVGWTLARTWPGDRGRERQLKRRGGASRHCPACYRPDLHAALAGAAAGCVTWCRRPDPGLVWAGPAPGAGVLEALAAADRAGLLTPLPRLCHPAHRPCPCAQVLLRLSAAGRGRLRGLQAQAAVARLGAGGAS